MLVEQVQRFRGAPRPRGFARLLVDARRILRERRQRGHADCQHDRHRHRVAARPPGHHLRHFRFPVIHKSIANRAVVIKSDTMST